MTTPCSDASRARDEPMLATASRVARWLLVEHAGPWGPQSLPLSRMEPAVGARLTAAGAEHGARVLLLRRPLGVPCPPGRRVYVVESRPGRERTLMTAVPDDDALARLPLPFDDVERPAGWHEVTAPLLLVCTHGRHDQCCAVRGRPVAAALSALRPEHVWECSHVGGDRFAANLLVLPHGLYLGRVPAADADALLQALDAGRLPLPWVRGRSSLPSPVQAAQHFAREATGRDRLDDLLPTAQAGAGRDTWTVVLAGPGGPDVEVVVAYDRAGTGVPQVLTCGADEAKTAPVFRQVSLRTTVS
jgi:hypothetical protein